MKKEEIKTTVYIPSHNYGKYLQEAIESVLRQTTHDWELFLIDEQSQDNTREIMELYQGDERVHIFQTSHLGLPGVANFVRKQAKGKYLIRLDADDVFDENILLVLSNYLDQNPEVALVFPDFFLIDDFGGVVRYEGRQTVYDTNHLLDVPAHGACTMVRKNVLDQLGGYREDLRMQDGFDLWTKVIQEYKCANVRIPLFYYRRHGENLTEDQVHILDARRAIKKDACGINLTNHRPVTAVIPCREHYDFFPNLWNQRLHNKTLLANTIELCLASSMFDHVVVTSDTDAVKDVMRQYPDQRLTFVSRSRKSTTISRSVSETLEHVIRTLRLSWNGVSVLAFLQAPFVKTESLEEAVYTLVMNNSDSAFAVQEMKEELFKRTAHGLSKISKQGVLKLDFDVIYASSNCSMATKNSNLKTGSLTGARISHFIIPDEEAFYIRDKRNFRVAEILKADEHPNHNCEKIEGQPTPMTQPVIEA
jgi:glycosyltransferase involved in cell wall biosynthesis